MARSGSRLLGTALPMRATARARADLPAGLCVKRGVRALTALQRAAILRSSWSPYPAGESGAGAVGGA